MTISCVRVAIADVKQMKVSTRSVVATCRLVVIVTGRAALSLERLENEDMNLPPCESKIS